MVVVKTHIIRQEYRDSVQLMRAAAIANKLEGIEIASVLMGTPKNKPLLKEVNLYTEEAQNAKPSDIIISIRARTEIHAENAIQQIIEFLTQEEERSHETSQVFRSIRGALQRIPDANLALISVPGEFAGREVKKALQLNLSVLLFSDNVPLEEEVMLKTEAHQRGLLLMGPDCGTAMIKNIGLGFSNVVLPGPIGIVAASGTGSQEVMVLCHHQGIGINHVIGTGSRDVKDIVGGITMIDGLRALEKDPSTELIIIVSKPPDINISNKILDEVKKCIKPVIINFLGRKTDYLDITNKILTVDTLEEAAYSATNFINTGILEKTLSAFNEGEVVEEIVKKTNEVLAAQQRYIRGLYAGGTFTFEAAMIISNFIQDEPIWTNVKLEGTSLIENIHMSKEHTLIDMGADEFTIGKPHPMIDQTERKKRFLKEIEDPETAVIILDLVLGYGAHEDPVGDLKEVLVKWKSNPQPIPIVAHVCGTDLDPQDYELSIRLLEKFGVYVMPTNAQAARLAVHIVTRGKLLNS